jgi:hypothetical protein
VKEGLRERLLQKMNQFKVGEMSCNSQSEYASEGGRASATEPGAEGE